MDHGFIFIVIAYSVGLWMTWGIGANDLANIMSTAMGSKAISVKQALLIAIVFEIAGAFLGGNEVSDTIRNGIIDISGFSAQPELLVYSMLSVLFAGAFWITLASYLGMPVSITNSIVGALVGVGAIMLGFHAVHWQKVGYIALSWLLSPTIAGVAAYLLFISIRRSILGADDPFSAAKRYVPIYLSVVGIILAFMLVVKALHHFHVKLAVAQTLLVVMVSDAVIMLAGFLALRGLFAKSAQFPRHTQFTYIESMFSVLMAFTACAMVFAHGSNDVAIAVGPVAAVLGLVKTEYLPHSIMLNSITLFGCLGVVLGLFMYGRKVIETVGTAITTLTPSRAFAATLAAASTVVVSTSTGIPCQPLKPWLVRCLVSAWRAGSMR